ncbi:MAG: type II toxin-antitoxin system VapC family toxin [Candidatus Marinimicrobia bacterium]|nr:type II toxin-antitoxin system VapC family toxin [Candidatus Neomarinimicrobiota bacterium]MCH7763028.1 type II toxin-antitoxin system VapC family toxin [Candidatus Neomarinimicrobiota bacterium]
MENKKVIIDSGPLVAFLNKSDQYHLWAKNQFSQLKPPFYTCESVLSELLFLMQYIKNGTAKIIALLDRDLIKIQFHLDDEINAVNYLLKKYSNVPMSLADSCLVRMCEQISNSVICTLDSDFRTYRKERRNIIPLIIPK